jgi:hypothetical protein
MHPVGELAVLTMFVPLQHLAIMHPKPSTSLTTLNGKAWVL